MQSEHNTIVGMRTSYMPQVILYLLGDLVQPRLIWNRKFPLTVKMQESYICFNARLLQSSGWTSFKVAVPNDSCVCTENDLLTSEVWRSRCQWCSPTDYYPDSPLPKALIAIHLGPDSRTKVMRTPHGLALCANTSKNINKWTTSTQKNKIWLFTNHKLQKAKKSKGHR